MKFNEKTTVTKTENLAGGESYSQSPELELVSILLTSFANNQFYEKADTKFDRIIELLNKVNPLFAAKAAIYARTEFGMRSISHVLASELAKHISGLTWAKDFYKSIVYRPDDMTEILSYHKRNGKISNAIKKGFAEAFNKFDAYQLAKYRGTNNSIKLIDVVNLVHPKGTDKNKKALNQLVNGTLKSIDTWESKLSNAGKSENKEESKKEAWTELIKTKKLGYFALLRNLRNILEQAPEIINDALSMLTDENLIKKSLVLPFRYFTAIQEIKKLAESRNVIIALSQAAEISLNNVPELPGKTLIAVDVSGSMSGRPAQIAKMFGSILYKSTDSILLTFDYDSRFISLNPTDSLLTLMKNIPFTGGGTNFNSIFKLTQKVDRIVILSDMQAWMRGQGYLWCNSSNPKEAFKEYRNRTGANPKVYSFDLAGHGTMQFPEQNVYALAGFSEKIFDIMKLLESDKNALITKINSIEL